MSVDPLFRGNPSVYNARYYDPQIARFVTADNRIDGQYSTQGWNRFSYVHNNPIMYKDPTGHDAEAVDAAIENAGKNSDANLGQDIANDYINDASGNSKKSTDDVAKQTIESGIDDKSRSSGKKTTTSKIARKAIEESIQATPETIKTSKDVINNCGYKFKNGKVVVTGNEARVRVNFDGLKPTRINRGTWGLKVLKESRLGLGLAAAVAVTSDVIDYSTGEIKSKESLALRATFHATTAITASLGAAYLGAGVGTALGGPVGTAVGFGVGLVAGVLANWGMDSAGEQLLIEPIEKNYLNEKK